MPEADKEMPLPLPETAEPTPESGSGTLSIAADAVVAATDRAVASTHSPVAADDATSDPSPVIRTEPELEPPSSSDPVTSSEATASALPAVSAAATISTPPPTTPEAASLPAEAPASEATSAQTTAPTSNKKWYVVRVTSGREETIKAAIERRVKIDGLEEYFGQIVIPVERVTEVKKVKETKNGEKITKEKRVIKERKKFPGYIMVEVEFNDRILYLFRETAGVADFVGSAGPLKPPPPMSDLEVRRMLGEAISDKDKKGKDLVIKLDYEKGDKVRIREGAFANMEGEVKEISMPKDANETPKVKVEVTIFGRGVPVDLDYWQVDKV